MGFEVTDVEGSETKTVSKINLGLDGVPDKVASQIKNDVGQYILEQVIQSLGNAETPIAGEKWPALTKKYQQWKEKEGGVGEANMQLFGDMLAELDYQETDEGIEVGFFDTNQAWKADGHLKFSGSDNNTPQRRFLPGEGEEFKGPIQKEIERIIADGLSSQVSPADFKEVDSKTSLYDVLRESLGSDLSRSELALAVARNDDLYQILEDEDLLQYL